MKYIFTLSELKSKEKLEELKDSYNFLYSNSWQDTETIAFGKDLPKHLEFKGFEIVAIKDLYENGGVEQYHRQNGLNDKIQQVQKSIEGYGWKAKHVPPQVIKCGTGWDVGTGNTRLQILASRGVTHMVVATYDVNVQGEYAYEQALIEAGQTFNCQSDPASLPDKKDIINAVSKLVDLYKKSDGAFGIPNDIDKIREKVLELSKATFTPKTRDVLSFTVHNTHNPNGAIAAWQTSGNAKWNIDKAKTNTFKLHDSENVRYLITTSSKTTLVWQKAIKEANDYPNADIRIIAHTGVLDLQGGYDFEEIFKDRCRDSLNQFNSLKGECLSFVLSALKDEKNKEILINKFNRISFYGVYPSLTDCHNMDTIIHYNSNNKTFTQTQKDKSTYSFKLDKNDESCIDELIEELLEKAA